MADIDTQPRLVRFGEFELDLHTGELRKAGVRLKFGGQPSQVLGVLLERPGTRLARRVAEAAVARHICGRGSQPEYSNQ